MPDTSALAASSGVLATLLGALGWLWRNRNRITRVVETAIDDVTITETTTGNKSVLDPQISPHTDVSEMVRLAVGDVLGAVRHDLAETRAELAQNRLENAELRRELAETRAENEVLRTEVADLRRELAAYTNPNGSHT